MAGMKGQPHPHYRGGGHYQEALDLLREENKHRKRCPYCNLLCLDLERHINLCHEEDPNDPAA